MRVNHFHHSKKQIFVGRIADHAHYNSASLGKKADNNSRPVPHSCLDLTYQVLSFEASLWFVIEQPSGACSPCLELLMGPSWICYSSRIATTMPAGLMLPVVMLCVVSRVLLLIIWMAWSPV